MLASDGFERELCILAVQRVAEQLAPAAGQDAIRLVKVMLGPTVRLTFEQGRFGRTTVEMPPDWYAIHNPDDVIRKRLGELIERERAKKSMPIGRRGHW